MTVGYDAGPNANATVTSTILASGSSPATVVVSTPFNYVTLRTGFDAGENSNVTSTRTVPASNGTGTVEISTAFIYSSSSTTGFDGGPTQSTVTRTSFASRQQNRIGTIYVSTPYGYTTVSSSIDEGPNVNGTFTSTIIATGAPPAGTVLFLTPYIYSTTTSVYPAQGVITAPTTITQRPNNQSITGFVIVQTQPPLVTTTIGYIGAGVRTSTIILPSGPVVGTVAVLTPFQSTSITTFYDGGPQAVKSFFQTNSPSDNILTIIVSIPYAYVTQTTNYDGGTIGSTRRTGTIKPGQATPTGSVIISQPNNYIVVTTTFDGGPAIQSYRSDTTFNGDPATQSSRSRTVLPTGTMPGTIITSYAAPYTTLFNGFDFGPGIPTTSRSTSTIRPSGSIATGTVLVLSPYPYDTYVDTYDGRRTPFPPTATRTVAPSDHAGVGLLYITEPDPFSEITTQYDLGPVQRQTSTSYPPYPGQSAWKVFVFTPAPYITITSQFDLAEHSTVQFSTISAGPDAAATGTVLIDPPNNYIVSYVNSDEGPSGSVRVTSTILPSAGNPGTFIITRPYIYVSVYRYSDLGNTAGLITTTLTPNAGNPIGTIATLAPLIYSTTTVGWDQGPGGTLTSSSTVPGPPPTLLKLTPFPYSSETTSYDGGFSGTVTIVVTVSVTNGKFGRIITSTPAIYVVYTRGYDAGISGVSNSVDDFLAANNFDGTGTRFLYTPYDYITIFSTTNVGPSGSVAPSTSLMQPAGAPTPVGTLISYIAARYDRTTLLYSGSDIITSPVTQTSAPSGSISTGALVVLTQPPVATPVLPIDLGPVNSTVITSTLLQPAVAPTVFILTPLPYTTTTLVGNTTSRYASTITPSGNSSTGTILVYTPARTDEFGITPPTSVPTFNCSGDSYLVSNVNNTPSFFRIDLATGQQTLISSTLGNGSNSINAIGYNTLDNTLYGVINTQPFPRLIRIGAGGQVATSRVLPVQAGPYNAGDVDENGDAWFSFQGREWIQLRLSSLQIVASGKAKPLESVYDWAYVPGGGNYLYAVGIDTSGRTSLPS